MERISDVLSGFFANDPWDEFNAEFDRGASSLGSYCVGGLDDSVLTAIGDFDLNDELMVAGRFSKIAA
tara:strand:- start:287 stop:490 length:204 start_codon:yes stop_codon:yes gene_type:complete